MKRAYKIRIERGENWIARDFLIVAASDEEAVAKAKREIRKEYDFKNLWRCTSLTELDTPLVT